MIEFIDFLSSFGNQMLEYVWFPLLVWTIIAVPVTYLLHRAQSIAPVYQYHSRVALVLALPLGIAGAFLTQYISSGAESGGAATFIVIQNPISVSASAAGASGGISLSDPMLWMGIVGLLFMAGTLYYLAQLLSNLLELKKMERNLHFKPLSQCRELVSRLPGIDKATSKVLVAYSPETQVPFTYGWRKTKIVVPDDLKDDGESLSMAVQHELMHIKHRDFLLNGIMVLVKAAFWFHPLIHHLYNSAQEYREITCDGEVLASNQFSKKRYATLLFELARREHKTKLAMSMAVNPSSLKKRIQIMSTQSNITSKFRSSALLTLVSAMLIVATISCTDMTSDGITKQEVEQTQSQVASANLESQPLFVVNGEVYSDKDKVSRIKSKYIKNINILKGEKATDKYGSKAENGAFEITLLNPEKAFSDLKDEKMLIVQKTPPSSKDEDNDIYVKTDKMPKLEGGLAALQQKINYPEEAREANEQGRVIVQFVVDEQGNVVDPQIIKGASTSLDQEALRVVKQAEFSPGTQDGKPVRVQYSLPITFKLPSDSPEQG